jgi:hypothetical protein
MRDFDNAENLRRRGSRLVALALKVHEIGHADYADQITERAAQLLDEATLRDAPVEKSLPIKV